MWLAHTLLIAADDLPTQTGDFQVSPTYFLVLIGVGFLVGSAGHLFKSKLLIATGIMLIFLATLAIPLFYAIFK